MRTAAVNGMSDLVSGIVNALSGLPGQMVSIGTNIVQGIWNGINDAVGWVLSKIRGFGNQVLEGIKDIFGIASPSRLMRDEVGKYLAEGIGVGFEDEIKNVNKQIQDSINTDFAVKSNILSGIRSNPAYQAAAVDIPVANSAAAYSIALGDIIVQGNVTDEALQDIQAALQENAGLIQDIVYSRAGMKKFNAVYYPTEQHVNAIARLTGTKW